MPELLETQIPGLGAPRKGKVREVYDLGSELLIVATDRISAFDVIMANGIPDKGAILTQMSSFWFNRLASASPHHLISTDGKDIDDRLGSHHPELHRRSTIAKKAKPLPVECVARGYTTGSLYKEYRAQGGGIHGLELPPGLIDGSKLPELVFTPAGKAQEGHDENISFSDVVNLVGKETAEHLQTRTLRLFSEASEIAQSANLILADTKFEFGSCDEGIILIDEALTPDSSRFWEASLWEPGQAQPSFDKQFVRNFLETLDWNKQPPGPKLPPDVVEQTRAKYLEAYRRLVGMPFETG